MENQEVDLAKALEFVEAQIALAEAIQRLKNNPDFKLVFEKRYVTDWSLTQTANFSSYNPEQRKGYMEQLLARSIFSDYIYEIEEDGRTAKDARVEIRNELDEMLKG